MLPSTLRAFSGHSLTQQALTRAYDCIMSCHVTRCCFVSQDVQQAALVELLVLCTEHPVQEIAVIPLGFWYRFSCALERLCPVVLRQSKLREFGPWLNKLIDVLIQLLRCPANIDELSSDQVRTWTAAVHMIEESRDLTCSCNEHSLCFAAA